MRSSVVIAVTGALMAAASPILEERKVVWKTAVAIKWITHTVTAKGTSTTSSTVESTTSTVPTTSAEPTTSEAPPPPVESQPAAPVVPVVPEQPAAPAFVPDFAPVREIIPDVAPQAPAPQPQAPQPQAPAPVQQAPVSNDYAETMLYHHNVHRQNHSAPSLSWSDDLAKYAAQSASRCTFEHDLTPGGGGYGQNLAFWGGSQGASFGINRAGAQAASNMWYNGELNKFPSNGYGQANPGGDFHEWGHFSQLVWAGTTKVGCVSKVCSAGTLSSMESIYTICNYSPAGNMGGQYGNNIRAPQGQPGVIAS